MRTARARFITPAALLNSDQAARLRGMHFNARRALRTNDVLSHEAWEQIDQAVVREAQLDRPGIQDLRDRGLTRGPFGLGMLIDQWQTMGEFGDAEHSMSALAEGEQDMATYGLHGVPIPITFKPFQLDIRTVQASENGIGEAVDVTYPELATRRVVYGLNDLLFNGGGPTLNGSAIEGYTMKTGRQTFSLAASWTAAGADPKGDVLAGRQKLIDKGFDDGPYGVYVPTAYEEVLEDDYKTETETTVRERLERISGIQFVKSAPDLAADNVVVVQLTRDVVDLSIGEDIMAAEWELQGGLGSRTKVMAAMAPRIKHYVDSSGSNQAGVAHGT